MKVIIHSCDKRLWYVREFLAPALRAQGIEPSIHNDDYHEGNLRAYINSFRGLDASDDGTWHLEDDVFPCRDFVTIARKHDNGIVHGFYHRYGHADISPGWVTVMVPGWSFPCIRIPNRLAVEFAEWFLDDAQHRDIYKEWVTNGKHIDSFWDNFLKEVHPEEKYFNLKPSIVEHVDELIGGSIVNKFRDGPCRAEYFDDPEVIEDLKIKLAHR